MKHLKTFESFNADGLDKVDEIFGFSKEEREAKSAGKREDAKKAIMAHPSKRQAYSKLTPEKQEKYVDAVVANPGVNYFIWNEEKQAYVPSGKFKVASGEGTSGK